MGCFDVISAPLSAGIKASGDIAAANINAGAQRDAAKTSAQASEYGTQIQGMSAADALAFEEAQAENTAQNTEVNRRANFDQWAAHQHDVSSVGAILGLPGKTIPAYVPGVTPNYTSLQLPYDLNKLPPPPNIST